MHECSQYLLCFYMKVKVLVTQSFCNCLQPHGLSMDFSKQKYWSGLPFPSPGDLPDPGNEAGSSALQADSLPAELREVPHIHTQLIILPSPLAHGR